ncbi:ABC transporter substrate-binding protein [Virgibacillus necropolis]|uniref:ABC transporter substrate-binding protein n=1 Tax=Virgibacillus necropolis TaxID=163877 RepID=A0A221MGG4_9BACI|nr:extracellular solute-binding protein [Virgibacillus necropolis]ASN06702.1 ABC transporter substrate-binding protein [Virgibacillus necropolis]
MKHRFLTWFSILVVAFALAGCSGNDEASGDNGEDGVTIKFHTWINDEVGNWDEVIAAFEKEHPGINVETIPLVENMSNDDYLKKLDLLASSGEQLDVFMFANSLDLSKRVSAGLVAPIDSFVEEEGLNVEEEYNNTYAPINGSYYGLPAKLTTNLVLLNKDHLDAAGLEIPTDWTWNDYKEYAKKLTKGEGTEKTYGSYFHTWPDTYLILKLLGKSKNINIINEDGSSNMDDPLLKETLKLRYEMEQEDKTSVPLSATLSQKLDYRQQFFSQSASMIPTASYMITEWGEFTPDFTMAWAPWPKNKEDGPSYARMGGDIMSIAKNSEHKEEAYKFIRWFTTEGIKIQNISIPSWTKTDLNEVVDNLISTTPKPEAIHKESLLYTLKNSEASEVFVPQPFLSEAYSEFNAEAEMYLLGEQDLETTISNAKKKVQAIIDNNK